MKKAVFLDRDGTIIADMNYLQTSDKIKILPGVAEALRKLREAGYLLVIITNQSGVGRGYFSTRTVGIINSKMVRLFKKEGVVFDKITICPHHPEDHCLCRKPKPGMIIEAAKSLNIDISESAVIGDKMSDIEAGLAAGCDLNILLTEKREDLSTNKAVIAGNMLEAAEIILSGERWLEVKSKK